MKSTVKKAIKRPINSLLKAKATLSDLRSAAKPDPDLPLYHVDAIKCPSAASFVFIPSPPRYSNDSNGFDPLESRHFDFTSFMPQSATKSFALSELTTVLRRVKQELEAFQLEIGALRELKERCDVVYRNEIKALKSRIAYLETEAASCQDHGRPGSLLKRSKSTTSIRYSSVGAIAQDLSPNLPILSITEAPDLDYLRASLRPSSSYNPADRSFLSADKLLASAGFVSSDSIPLYTHHQRWSTFEPDDGVRPPSSYDPADRDRSGLSADKLLASNGLVSQENVLHDIREECNKALPVPLIPSGSKLPPAMVTNSVPFPSQSPGSPLSLTSMYFPQHDISDEPQSDITRATLKLSILSYLEKKYIAIGDGTLPTGRTTSLPGILPSQVGKFSLYNPQPQEPVPATIESMFDGDETLIDTNDELPSLAHQLLSIHSASPAPVTRPASSLSADLVLSYDVLGEDPLLDIGSIPSLPSTNHECEATLETLLQDYVIPSMSSGFLDGARALSPLPPSSPRHRTRTQSSAKSEWISAGFDHRYPPSIRSGDVPVARITIRRPTTVKKSVVLSGVDSNSAVSKSAKTFGSLGRSQARKKAVPTISPPMRLSAVVKPPALPQTVAPAGARGAVPRFPPGRSFARRVPLKGKENTTGRKQTPGWLV